MTAKPTIEIRKNQILGADIRMYQTIADLPPDVIAYDPLGAISVTTPNAAASAREAALLKIFGTSTLDTTYRPVHVETIHLRAYDDTPNLGSIQRFTVEMDYGIVGFVNIFVPLNSRNSAMIYHEGHGAAAVGKVDTIESLIADGYIVATIDMPLNGDNPTPIQTIVPGVGPVEIWQHEGMARLDSDASALRFFLQPTLATVNFFHDNGLTNIGMMGLSGGGWTTTLYSALDPRILHSYSVAGTLPTYLRPSAWRPSIGDWEQKLPGLSDDIDYLDLYVLAATDGRPHWQIYNVNDPICFNGTIADHFKDAVSGVASGIGGEFQVLYDFTATLHQVTPWALDKIKTDMAEQFPPVFFGTEGDEAVVIGGGFNEVVMGDGDDTLVINWSSINDDIGTFYTGHFSWSGSLAEGYNGTFAYLHNPDDLRTPRAVFTGVEHFKVTLGAGNDQIRTGDGKDEVHAGAGADYLNGEGGNDSLDGGNGDDTLIGGSGDDMLKGGQGDDKIDGGSGTDAVLFDFNYSDAMLSNANGLLIVDSSDGRDELSNIEKLQFRDGMIELVDTNSLVDDVAYVGLYGDVFVAGVDPDWHYAHHGWREGRDPNRSFSTSGYISANGDVDKADINPLEHYHQFGWKEGRDASVNFDTTLYLLNNPDVRAANIDPLEHYLAHGRAEGRQTHKAVGQGIKGTFDAEYYLLANPDVGEANIDAALHFQNDGWKEGRDPNAYFDTSAYLGVYQDVAAAGFNPLEHYNSHGWKEGRDPSGEFDTSAYLDAYPDVAAAGINPLEHYLRFGIYEGRCSFGDGIIG